MELHICQKNGLVLKDGFTSKKKLCEHYNIPYSSTIKGKSIHIIDNNIYHLFTVEVNRIQNRGNENLKK